MAIITPILPFDDLPSYITRTILIKAAEWMVDYVDQHIEDDQIDTDTPEEIPVRMPFQLSAYIAVNCGTNAYSGHNVQVDAIVGVDIPIGSEPDDYFTSWTLTKLDGRTYPEYAYDTTDIAYFQETVQNTRLRKNDGYFDLPVYLYANQRTLYTILDDRKVSDIFTYWKYNNNGHNNGVGSVLSNIQLTTYSNTPMPIINGAGTRLMPIIKTMPLFQGGGSNQWNTTINNAYNVTNNTYNYTTSNGDTVTTYYGDNITNIDYKDYPLTYNDYRNILNQYVDNVKDDIPELQDFEIPTYEVIKYGTDLRAGQFQDPYMAYPKLPDVRDEMLIDDADETATINGVIPAFGDFISLPFDIMATLGLSAVFSALILMLFFIRKFKS